MDVIITSNSPGELAAWVAPVVAQWRVQHPDWRLILALVPCPFASGHEMEFASNIEGISEIWTPKQTLKILLGGKLPRPRAERGMVVYLGGDAWHAWGLGKRWRYPCVAYAVHSNPLWRSFVRVATQREPLAQKLLDRGVNARHIGYVGWSAPVPEKREEDEVCIGLFPGSRTMLLRYTLGPFLEIFRRMKVRMPKARFILAISPFVQRSEVQDILAKPGYCGVELCGGEITENGVRLTGGEELEIAWGNSRRVLAQIDCAVAIPGTNTGELAAAGKALVVALSSNVPLPRGGLGWLLEHIPGFKKFQQRQHLSYYKHQRFAAQPNRWANEMIAPEIMVSDDLNVLVDKAVEIFDDEKRRTELGQRLAQVMGDPGKATRELANFLATGE